MKNISAILLVFVTLAVTACSLVTDNIVIRNSEAITENVNNASIFFDKNSYYVNSHYSSIVEDISIYLSKNQNVKIRINGYTDTIGGSEYNIALGQRRANSVYEIMKILGVAETQMEVVSFGKEKFHRSSDTFENDLAKNRRVDILIQH